MNEDHPLSARVAATREEAVERVVAALKDEGFGVLTRIDMDQAFREKLGADFRPYTILGACNPALAHQALTARSQVGLLLPCNVTVDQEGEGDSLVRIVDPLEMLASAMDGEDQELSEIAREARERLERVAMALSET